MSTENQKSGEIKLGAYKLREIAAIENIHYQTVLERKKRGVYVAVVTKSGKAGKQSYRYLTAEASNAFRAIFATLGDTAVDFCPTVPVEEPKEDSSPPKEDTDTF